MRQLFFAIVLVAAAFGGGAMVNGPGFRWAQDHFFDYMGLKDGGEIATIDLPPAPTDDDDPDARPTPPPPPAAAPAAVAPVQADRRPEPRPAEPVAAEPVAAEPTARPAPRPDPGLTPPPLLSGPSGAPGPAPSAPPAPLDPGVAPALLASLSPTPAPASRLDAPAPDPAPAPVPAAGAKSASATAPTPEGGDWGELRRKLEAQGVTRYSIEADLRGRAVFSCLIPLAGKQAVSQRFEAEGDDEFEAANAALRRIKLWRATQAPAPASS